MDKNSDSTNTREELGTFPFGNPVLKISQMDKTTKPIFILGNYGSAVLAQFIIKDKKKSIHFLPVDNEPEIFWNGELKDAKKLVSNIKIPTSAPGKLIAEGKKLNGILGRVLDKYYLRPLKLNREHVWICNLIPHLVANKYERKAIKKYNDMRLPFNLPKADVPSRKERWNYITRKRLREIVEEIFQARPEYIITLGRQPLKWFLSELDPSIGNLLDAKDYGEVKHIKIHSISLKLITLFHPDQLIKENGRETRIGLLHYDWLKTRSKKIKISI